MKYDKRIRALQLIHDYLIIQQLNHAEVTASDIVAFHQLHRDFSYTLAATMKYVHERGKPMQGFRVKGVRISRKDGSPTKYSIELVEGASDLIKNSKIEADSET